MAASLAGAGVNPVGQIAHRMPREQIAKRGANDASSRFDRLMDRKASAAKPPIGINPAQRALPSARAERIRRLEQVTRSQRTSFAHGPVRAPKGTPSRQEISRVTSTMQKVVEDLEMGQGALDRLINGSLRGRQFSQTELLALQASMYKYSQELDLTSKVVEKATNGLKDTLKTQV